METHKNIPLHYFKKQKDFSAWLHKIASRKPVFGYNLLRKLRLRFLCLMKRRGMWLLHKGG